MQMIGEIVENELKNALEVKDEKSLHRGISFLIDSIPHKEVNDAQHEQFREAFLKMDGKMDATLNKMSEGFKLMDERFEASDKRFDDMNRRFDMQYRFTTIGFILLATLMSIYQFIG